MRGCERPGDLLGAIQAGSMQRQDTEDYRAARFNLHVAATRAKRTVNIMTPQHDPSPLLPWTNVEQQSRLTVPLSR
jgi:hypothetical protein